MDDAKEGGRMKERPIMKLLDLFCGAGGAAMGYHLAGFDSITGVDCEPQTRYPFGFVQGDALEYAAAHAHEFDVIHASPPCQAYSKARNLQGNEHPDLVATVRELLRASGKPYVIENVQGAPLINPITLVGSMFGLRTMRPRLFECSFDVPFVLAPPPAAKHAKMGRPPKDGEYVHAVGHMSNVPYCRDAMGIDWMTQSELAQAIPPAYCEFIGKYLMEAIKETA
jgi:DNA (cytosine-5)-methyltransferase 1